MLEIRGLHTYYGLSHILHDVSLTVAKGEVVALLGRNGAGKSTTFKSVMGIVRPGRGEVLLNGRNIVGLRPFRIARLGIGYVPEDRRCFPNLTVRDNLEMGQREGAGGRHWTVERVFAVFPMLRALEKSKGMQLSGGEQQMLTIARALMTNPQLLLLDEPSEGLAPVIVEQLGDLIREITRDVTILLAEQNARFALGLADRVFIMEKGRIAHEGTAAAIRKDHALQERYLAL